MAMFIVASIPLINKLYSCANIRQLWYADDATASGSLVELRRWWDSINVFGNSFGYTPNAANTSLLVKESAYELRVISLMALV